MTLLGDWPNTRMRLESSRASSTSWVTKKTVFMANMLLKKRLIKLCANWLQKRLMFKMKILMKMGRVQFILMLIKNLKINVDFM